MEKKHNYDLPSDMIDSIEDQYVPNTRGGGYRAIAANLNLPWQTVRNVCDRIQTSGTGEARKRGRKPGLSAGEEREVRRRLDSNPFATNAELAASVENKVTPRTISNVLKKANPPYTKKRVVDQEPEELTDEWKQEVRRFINGPLKRIPLTHRVYADESAIYGNEAPRYGRSRRGVKIRRGRAHYAKKWTIHVFIKKDHVIHWELSSQNANDAEVLRVLRAAAPKLRRGETLIWDRLGKSGRCRNPKSQHYNPEVRERLQQRGVELLFLPPKGKYLNPTELLFDDLKQHHLRQHQGWKVQNFTEAQMKRIISNYMTNVAPKNLPGFFASRANGQYLLEQGLLD